jgi:hypothetical protein
MPQTLTLVPGIGDIVGNRTYMYDNTGQPLLTQQVFSGNDNIEITFMSTSKTDGGKTVTRIMSLVYDNYTSSTTTRAEVLLSTADIIDIFGVNAPDITKTFTAIIYNMSTNQSIELFRRTINWNDLDSIVHSFNPAQTVTLRNIQDNDTRTTFKIIPDHNHTVIPDSTLLYVQAVQYTVHSGNSISNFFLVKTVPIQTPAPTYIPNEDAFWKNNDDSYTLVIAGLQNGETYEASVFLEYNTGTSSNSSPGVQLYPNPVANAIESLSIDTIFIEGNLIDASNVKITGTWEDNDAFSYISYSYDPTSEIRDDYPDGSNSLIKVRFGSSDAIYDASNVYNYTGDFSNNIVEVTLTNGQVRFASHDPLVIEAILPILDWSTYQAVITQGIELRAQLVADIVGNNLINVNGIISDPIQAYIQTVPILQNPKVATNLVSGEQTFYFNGEILSLDVTGASFKIFNKGVDLSVDSAVSLQEPSLPNIVERNDTISNVTNGDIIYATVSVPDRNGTIDPLSNDVYIYSVNTQDFIQTRLTQPGQAVYNFTGNKGNTDTYLHTVLTDINNDSVSTSGYDASENSIIWELYHYNDSNNISIDTFGNYQIVDGNVDISYNFDVTQDYYLQVTKTGTLNMFGTNYNNYLYNLNVPLALTISTVSIPDEGPIYFMANPVIANIKVSVEVASGEQAFYFNGQIPSLDVSGASLSVTNGETSILGPSAVVLNQSDSSNIQQKFVVQTYDEITSGANIVATLVQLDRNGTIDSETNEKYTYSAVTEFVTTKFKTPQPADYNFTGNEGNTDADLHTVLTNINNETNAFDISATSVDWVLYHGDPSNNNNLIDTSGNYLTVGENVDISYNFDVTQDYYLRVTKNCTLIWSDASYNYNDANYKYVDASNIDINVQIVSPQPKGPIYFMANPVIANIKVSVEVASGEQTFYFDGQIPSLDVLGASLSVTNGGSLIIDGSAVVLNQPGSSNIQQKSVVQSYEDITSEANIAATLVQLDRNGTIDPTSGNVYTYSAVTEFVTTKFKTPDQPNVDFEKNAAGNDDTMYTTITSLGNNNGYDITNISWQVDISNNANEDNLLADISGVYDVLNDSTIYNTKLSIDGSGNFSVDDPYYLKVTTSYELPNDVYNNYNNHILSPNNIDASGNISLYLGPVYYMGNPTINSIDISGQSIKIEVYTHGTTLANQGAFTLVLVAKDGLSGYANGVLSGNMGTSVFLSGVTITDSDLVEGSQSLGDNKNYVYTFNINNNPTIDINATCIGIVDVTNGNSAVSLSNFPSVNISGVLTNPDFNSAEY